MRTHGNQKLERCHLPSVPREKWKVRERLDLFGLPSGLSLRSIMVVSLHAIAGASAVPTMWQEDSIADMLSWSSHHVPNCE